MISYWKLLLIISCLLLVLAFVTSILFTAIVSFVYGLWIVGVIATIVFVMLYVWLIHSMIRFMSRKGL